MTTLAVLAADPGKTTGYASWFENLDDGDPASGEVPDPMEFLGMVERWAYQVAGSGGYEGVLVAERFIITPETAKKTQAPWSLEVSGGMRFLAHRHGLAYVQQTPAEAKRLIHDERLKALGWHRPGLRHANDALRHLAYHLARRNVLTLPATKGV